LVQKGQEDRAKPNFAFPYANGVSI
jgi:hypothetical protein